MWIVIYNDEHGNVIEKRFDDIFNAAQFMIIASTLYSNVRTFKEPFSRGE